VGKTPKLFSKRNDEKFIRKEVKLIRTKTKKWYIAIPIVKQINNLTEKSGEICALDPGVRTFQTVYGTDGLIAQVGTSFETIEKDLLKADNLISKHSKSPTQEKKKYTKQEKKKYKQKKKKYKKRYLRIFEKVRNRIRDLHHKVASWLCRTYRVILLPKFETASMVSKHQLSHKTCRSMLTWSHYAFQTRLKHHAQHHGVKLRIVNEAYTSKTCGCCGKVNGSLGASKTFNCASCNSKMDRDENAARNIMLRNLSFVFE
jgi:IS605 OrfB family transposase